MAYSRYLFIFLKATGSEEAVVEFIFFNGLAWHNYDWRDGRDRWFWSGSELWTKGDEERNEELEWRLGLGV